MKNITTAGNTQGPSQYSVSGALDFSAPGSGLTIPNEASASDRVRSISFNIRIDDFSQDATIMTILSNASPPRGITVKVQNMELVIKVQFPAVVNFAEEAIVKYTAAEMGGVWNAIKLAIISGGAFAASSFKAGRNGPLVVISPTVGPPQYDTFVKGDIVISQFKGALSCITVGETGTNAASTFANTACLSYTGKTELINFI